VVHLSDHYLEQEMEVFDPELYRIAKTTAGATKVTK
jgi:hypothetical protein